MNEESLYIQSRLESQRNSTTETELECITSTYTEQIRVIGFFSETGPSSVEGPEVERNIQLVYGGYSEDACGCLQDSIYLVDSEPRRQLEVEDEDEEFSDLEFEMEQ